jgi:hypothetical protein
MCETHRKYTIILYSAQHVHVLCFIHIMLCARRRGSRARRIALVVVVVLLLMLSLLSLADFRTIIRQHHYTNDTPLFRGYGCSISCSLRISRRARACMTSSRTHNNILYIHAAAARRTLADNCEKPWRSNGMSFVSCRVCSQRTHMQIVK